MVVLKGSRDRGIPLVFNTPPLMKCFNQFVLSIYPKNKEADPLAEAGLVKKLSKTVS
jgi:hypothetical protein